MMSASTRAREATLRRAASSSAALRASTPSPVRALTSSTGTPARPSWTSSRSRSRWHACRSASLSRSTWLSTMSTTSVWDVSPRRYRSWMAASAYFWGSTTQTMRSTSATRRSASSRCSVLTESWSGRSSTTSPSSSRSSAEPPALGRAPAASAPAPSRWWRRRTPSQSRSGPEPSWPRTTANASEVVGRSTSTSARGSPASALSREDLPEPVAPAKATTVCSLDRRSRWPALASTEAARSTTSPVSTPSPACTARCSASRRSTTVSSPTAAATIP